MLEDDCAFLDERFHYTFDVSSKTDALYLGHSLFGLSDTRDKFGLRWGRPDNVQHSDAGEGYIRVFNMLGRHAILYLSQAFVGAAMDAGERALLNRDFPIPGDVQYAEIQPDHTVLATRDPMCVQSALYSCIYSIILVSYWPYAF